VYILSVQLVIQSYFIGTFIHYYYWLNTVDVYVTEIQLKSKHPNWTNNFVSFLASGTYEFADL